ncbi:SRPBCC domain-containing protein [Haladaptatus sp. DYSN1]|uniref:SRPBCC domain-containing protein n=1 Tax=unclassified Haladaptatus TaxID=2622732 RepID=UPI002406A033|nr:SRPBCC domain-containing protein [Haladaptatus sp. DYSN1]
MSDQPNEPETGSIEVSRVIKAPAERIYKAFLDADALAKFSPPAGYTARYDHADGEVGGTYRGTFTSLDKSDEHSFSGEYVELVPNERIVQTDQFETDTPEMQSEMTVTITLEEVEDGTKVTVRQEGIPKPIPAEDAATGWGMSLENLARLVEYPEAE